MTSFEDVVIHPDNPKASAHGGAKRFPRGVSELITPVAHQDDIVKCLTGGDLDAIAATGDAIVNRAGRVVVMALTEPLKTTGLKGWLPIRRIATYQGAVNRIGRTPVESLDLDGRRLSAETESRLELSHLQDLLFNHGARALMTQPFALRWRVGDKFAWRVPDILAVDRDGTLVGDVKPEARRTRYHDLMFELTEASVARLGMRYRTLGSMTEQRQLNLNALAFHRWSNPHLAAAVASARAARRRSLGGVVDSAGGDSAAGEGTAIAAAMHLLTRELTADLNRPLNYGTPVEWANQ